MITKDNAAQWLPSPLRLSGAYKTWQSMKIRCDHKKYKTSNGNPLIICERWRIFANFYADMGERPNGMSIDRINGNLGYQPENCRWADKYQQARNRLSKKLDREMAIEAILEVFKGKRVGAVASKYGISSASVSSLITGRNWPGCCEEALARILPSRHNSMDGIIRVAYAIGYSDAKIRGSGYGSKMQLLTAAVKRFLNKEVA